MQSVSEIGGSLLHTESPLRVQAWPDEADGHTKQWVMLRQARSCRSVGKSIHTVSDESDGMLPCCRNAPTPSHAPHVLTSSHSLGRVENSFV